MGNTFGRIFRVTTFGESHGEGIGLILDGCPAGLKISLEEIQKELNRRRPGQSEVSTPRDEKDRAEVFSGIKDSITLGTPIGIFIRNRDQKPADYGNLKDAFRPGHADYTYHARYGIRDERGGGRSSNRESAARVAAGAIAKKLLAELKGIEVLAWVSKVHTFSTEIDADKVGFDQIEENIVRCPDPVAAKEMIRLIRAAGESGDSLGGTITFCARGCPPGVGSPVFDKLTADMAKALISINATRSFEIGMGEKATALKGSEHNDLFVPDGSGGIKTETNRAGGVLGGMSNGETLYGTLSFKPVSTVKKTQKTVNSRGEATELAVKGRHDPCVLPRAVPIVEAMLSLTLADHLMEYCLASLPRLKKAFQD